MATNLRRCTSAQVTVVGVFLSVATSDLLTSDLMFSEKCCSTLLETSDALATNLMLTRLFLFSTFYSLFVVKTS